MTPAVMILLGVPAPTAVGTDLATILCTSSFGLFKRRGSKTVDVKIASFIAAGSLFGVWFGSMQLEHLKRVPPLIVNGHEVVAAQYVLLWVFVGVLLGISGFMLLDARRNRYRPSPAKTGLLAGIALPPYGRFDSLEHGELPLIPLVLLGVIVGIFTGLMGIGGGVILLPALIYLVGQSTAHAVGTSLLLVWVSSLMGVLLNAEHGNIHVPLWIAMVAGGLSGASLGTSVGLKIAGFKLRMYFVYVILSAVVMIGIKLFSMTF